MSASEGDFSVQLFLDDRKIDARSFGITNPESFVDAAKSGFPGICESIRHAVKTWPNPTIVFRGHANCAWGIRSTLHRVLSGSGDPKVTETGLWDAEQRVIKAARDPIRVDGDRYGARLGLNLSDGQLLAVLQHQGAPTRFVDVTEDARVCLYFACEELDSVDGRLFFIALPDRNALPPASNYLDKGTLLDLGGEGGDLPWLGGARGTKMADSDWTSRVFLVDAGGLDPRMSAQRGLFVVGGCNRAYPSRNLSWNRRYLSSDELLQVSSLSIGFPKDLRSQKTRAWPAVAWTVKIPASAKPRIRSLLAQAGVDRDSLYPDYAGFSQLAILSARPTST
ncbi:MAG TPA: FRG domain-containing protein [Propionicimonas sp.]|nr:FRG domain-containing protein [Propionicimonas sp.]